MIHQAQLALEWFHASGERTPERLRSLVAHYCFTGAIENAETIEAIYQEAARGARFAD